MNTVGDSEEYDPWGDFDPDDVEEGDPPVADSALAKEDSQQPEKSPPLENQDDGVQKTPPKRTSTPTAHQPEELPAISDKLPGVDPPPLPAKAYSESNQEVDHRKNEGSGTPIQQLTKTKWSIGKNDKSNPEDYSQTKGDFQTRRARSTPEPQQNKGGKPMTHPSRPEGNAVGNRDPEVPDVQVLRDRVASSEDALQRAISERDESRKNLQNSQAEIRKLNASLQRIKGELDRVSKKLRIEVIENHTLKASLHQVESECEKLKRGVAARPPAPSEEKVPPLPNSDLSSSPHPPPLRPKINRNLFNR